MPLDFVIIGWREWIRLPDLETFPIKAKTDTGAWSNALHAIDVTIDDTKDTEYVNFRLKENGRLIKKEIQRWRNVRNTSGQETLRPVIKTKLEISGRDYQVEICLQDRSKMRHRIILGRNFLRNGFIVNPSREYMHTMVRSIPRIVIDE
jgi:hypothetical protein